MDSTGRLLLVDDEAPFREALSARLEASGFRVVSASCGEEAMEILERNLFEIVILDLFMPGIGGMETLRQIKKANHRTEVILLTGAPSVETALQGIRGGAFDYLVKPCDPDLLESRIRRAQEKLEMESLPEV